MATAPRTDGHKIFKCPIDGCGKSFTRKRRVFEHIYVHGGAKPYPCPECSLSYTRREHLQRHMLVHQALPEKPHKCPQCDKSFNLKHHLTQHLPVHRRDKCDICGKVFQRKKMLDKHMKIHESFPACSCGREFTSKRQYFRHMHAFHFQNFHCGLCDVVCNSRSELRSHAAGHRKVVAAAQPPESLKPDAGPSAETPAKKLLSAARRSVDSLTGLGYERRPLKCSVEDCDRRFTRQYDLDRHTAAMHPAIQTSRGSMVDRIVSK